MSGTGHSISHGSDTARWTALHRATESARRDALFRDPLAERLAGEHGRAIVANVRVVDARLRLSGPEEDDE
jgi:O-methyltransferase involved in polyketide biosynthesis